MYHRKPKIRAHLVRRPKILLAYHAQQPQSRRRSTMDRKDMDQQRASHANLVPTVVGRIALSLILGIPRRVDLVLLAHDVSVLVL